MVDWVHCNQCFRQPGNDHTFCLTSCGHIFCDDCEKEGTTNQCSICCIPCTTIALSAKMKPEVEIFFQDPADIIKKQYKQLIQVIDFQRNHRQRLQVHKKEKDAQMQLMMQTAKRQVDQAMDLEREVLRLQEENGKLRRLLSVSPGPGVVAKTSYRPGTPGRVLANSSIPPNVRNLVHQNSSQSISRSASPYGRPQHLDTSKTPQSQQPMTPTITPPGPARYSIRTPPVNGRIGTVGTPTGGNMTLTPSGTLISLPTLTSRTANTPVGLKDLATPGRNSPMNISPASSRRGFSALGNVRSSPSQGSMTPSLSQSSQNDPARRQIQLNYTPRRPALSAPPGSQHRQGKS